METLSTVAAALLALAVGTIVLLGRAALGRRFDRSAFGLGLICAIISFIALPKMHEAWRRGALVKACVARDRTACERALSFGGDAAKIAAEVLNHR